MAKYDPGKKGSNLALSENNRLVMLVTNDEEKAKISLALLPNDAFVRIANWRNGWGGFRPEEREVWSSTPLNTLYTNMKDQIENRKKRKAFSHIPVIEMIERLPTRLNRLPAADISALLDSEKKSSQELAHDYIMSNYQPRDQNISSHVKTIIKKVQSLYGAQVCPEEWITGLIRQKDIRAGLHIPEDLKTKIFSAIDDRPISEAVILDVLIELEGNSYMHFTEESVNALLKSLSESSGLKISDKSADDLPAVVAPKSKTEILRRHFANKEINRRSEIITEAMLVLSNAGFTIGTKSDYKKTSYLLQGILNERRKAKGDKLKQENDQHRSEVFTLPDTVPEIPTNVWSNARTKKWNLERLWAANLLSPDGKFPPELPNIKAMCDYIYKKDSSVDFYKLKNAILAHRAYLKANLQDAKKAWAIYNDLRGIEDSIVPADISEKDITIKSDAINKIRKLTPFEFVRLLRDIHPALDNIVQGVESSIATMGLVRHEINEIREKVSNIPQLATFLQHLDEIMELNQTNLYPFQALPE